MKILFVAVLAILVLKIRATFDKSEFVKNFASRIDVDKKKAENYFDVMIDLMLEEIKEKDGFYDEDLGKLFFDKKKGRIVFESCSDLKIWENKQMNKVIAEKNQLEEDKENLNLDDILEENDAEENDDVENSDLQNIGDNFLDEDQTKQNDNEDFTIQEKEILNLINDF